MTVVNDHYSLTLQVFDYYILSCCYDNDNNNISIMATLWQNLNHDDLNVAGQNITEIFLQR